MRRRTSSTHRARVGYTAKRSSRSVPSLTLGLGRSYVTRGQRVLLVVRIAVVRFANYVQLGGSHLESGQDEQQAPEHGPGGADGDARVVQVFQSEHSSTEDDAADQTGEPSDHVDHRRASVVLETDDPSGQLVLRHPSLGGPGPVDQQRLHQARQQATHQQISEGVHPAGDSGAADGRGDDDRLPTSDGFVPVDRRIADPVALGDQPTQVAVVGDEETREEIHEGDAAEVCRVLQQDQIDIVDRHAAELHEHEAGTQQDREDQADQRAAVQVRDWNAGIVVRGTRLRAKVVVIVGVKVIGR